MADEELGFTDDFEAIQEKLNKAKKESGETKKVERPGLGSTELPEPEISEDELSMEDEDDILGSKEEDEISLEEEIEEEEIKGGGKEEKEEKSKEEVLDEKAKEDLIKYLDEEGGGTKITIKGKEYDLRDLSPQEIKDRFSKAGRFYQSMEEVAQEKEDLKKQRRMVEQAARINLQNLEGRRTAPKEATVPEFLQEKYEDTDEVKALKKGMQTLSAEVGNLKQGVAKQSYQTRANQFYSEIERYKKDYPCASIDEVIALKSVRPDIPTEKVMEASHAHYSSPKFVESVLKANPELEREIYEKAVAKHSAKEQKTSKIGRRRAATAGSTKVSSEAKREPPKTFEEAEARAKAHLKAVKKLDEDL